MRRNARVGLVDEKATAYCDRSVIASSVVAGRGRVVGGGGV